MGIAELDFVEINNTTPKPRKGAQYAQRGYLKMR